MNIRTAEQKAQDYSAMGNSADLITAVIEKSEMADENAMERQDCVDRNTQHLELMVALSDWEGEDMTAINSAVSAGNNYVAE